MKVTNIEKCVGEDVEFEGAEHGEYTRYTDTHWTKHVGESVEQIYFASEYEPLEKAYNEFKAKEIVVLPPTIIGITRDTPTGGVQIVMCCKANIVVHLSDCRRCELHMEITTGNRVVCGYTGEVK